MTVHSDAEPKRHICIVFAGAGFRVPHNDKDNNANIISENTCLLQFKKC